MANLYLSRYAYPYQLIGAPPSPNLSLLITIPSFNEPDLILSLDSLRQCQPPKGDVEVMVVINESTDVLPSVSDQNQKSFEEAFMWAKKWNTDSFKTHIAYVNDLAPKHAGVGMARKIAMDEAVRRLEAVKNHEGVIACFDADATCDPNYLQALEKHFCKNPETPGCAIYFEHPLDQENSPAILLYELWLRYYVHGLSYAGFPYASHTVGSSMAVRSWAYQKQGGMNRRKAGEDFYFLHKIMPLGNFTELNTTRVIPSSRKSDRVPFGTGRAMINWENDRKDLSLFYHPRTFEDLKSFLDQMEDYYLSDEISLPDPIAAFLDQANFRTALERLRKQSSSPVQFRKHFFHWFDGLKVLKYVHYARDHFYELQPSLEAVNTLMRQSLPDEYSCLMKLREADRLISDR